MAFYLPSFVRPFVLLLRSHLTSLTSTKCVRFLCYDDVIHRYRSNFCLNGNFFNNRTFASAKTAVLNASENFRGKRCLIRINKWTQFFINYYLRRRIRQHSASKSSVCDKKLNSIIPDESILNKCCSNHTKQLEPFRSLRLRKV